jgi:hypothetical protein
MSSFVHPHHFFLFRMQSGRYKLAYGGDPKEAYDNLRLRLTPKEMSSILSDDFKKIRQQEIQIFVNELG